MTPSPSPHLSQALLADLGPGCDPAEGGGPLALSGHSPWTPGADQPVRWLLGSWLPQALGRLSPVFLSVPLSLHCCLSPFSNREPQWVVKRAHLIHRERRPWPSLVQNASVYLSQGQKYPLEFPCLGDQPCSPLCRKEVNSHVISLLGCGRSWPQERLRVVDKGPRGGRWETPGS